MKLEVLTQVILFTGHVIHCFPCLLTCFVAGSRNQPIFSHVVVVFVASRGLDRGLKILIKNSLGTVKDKDIVVKISSFRIFDDSLPYFIRSRLKLQSKRSFRAKIG